MIDKPDRIRVWNEDTKEMMAEHWEYKGLLLSAYAGDNIGLLNNNGAHGWELVTVNDGIAYMKRRLHQNMVD